LKNLRPVNAAQRAGSPSKLSFCLAAVAAFAFLAGCAPKRIPGTEIDDTDETRAIIAVMDGYRQAFEAKDPERVMSFIAETFEDNAGTGTPDDDLDYKTLRQALPKQFARAEDLRLEINVKKITLTEDEKGAQAIYYYTTTFRLPGLKDKPQSEAGLKMMQLKKVGDQWKVTSGI
jgi:hypothetical protein